MLRDIPLNIAYLIKDAILSPRQLFKAIQSDKFTNEILIAFFCGAILTFVKSFLIRRESSACTFFTNDMLNSLVVMLNNPKISWLVAYLGYFIFILLVFAMCRLFNKRATLKPIALSMMSLSGIGLIMQLLFYILKFILLNKFMLLGGYMVLLWIIFLSITAIRLTQNISYLKATLCFFIPALPAIFMAAFTVIAPYLAWLTYRT